MGHKTTTKPPSRGLRFQLYAAEARAVTVLGRNVEPGRLALEWPLGAVSVGKVLTSLSLHFPLWKIGLDDQVPQIATSILRAKEDKTALASFSSG